MGTQPINITTVTPLESSIEHKMAIFFKISLLPKTVMHFLLSYIQFGASEILMA